MWLDGLDVCQARIKRMLFFSEAVIVPGTVLFILNLALADVAYPVSSGIGPHISLVSLSHFLTNTFAYPVGLDFLLTQLDMALASKLGLKLLKGTLFLITVAVLAVWVLFSRRGTLDEKQKRLVALLLILTITLWTFLVIVTVVDGRGQQEERADRPADVAGFPGDRRRDRGFGSGDRGGHVRPR